MHCADQPLRAAGFPDGRDMTLEPEENFIESAEAEYEISGSRMWQASAICAHFLRSSDAARDPVDMQSERPFFLVNAFCIAMNAAVHDLPICLDESQILRFFWLVMNFF